MINFRFLQEQDQESVKKLMKEYPLQFPDFVLDMYPERWASYLFDRDLTKSQYVVAEHERGQVVGHAGYIHNDDQRLYEFVGVVVSPKHQRQGIGKDLLKSLSLLLKAQGISSVMLSTLGHPGNEETLAFYRSLGYQELKYETDYYTKGFSRVTFIKDL
ncbi:GNAT family N-acetyltransferase [Paenibacillus sp. N3/727]|uniref:GNAT family N-acetyltransferase n=1 Tax=Paenibacillus sp. N3/727 TaxID=2925845 RepID=UPI001F534749|nr:GNAT family N-acetyltransferase [Paenibacillus sp. N3/727]UNK16821.1 GNAT family N-acetyltransferase [Paenibacillus sp. N3/727]